MRANVASHMPQRQTFFAPRICFSRLSRSLAASRAGGRLCGVRSPQTMGESPDAVESGGDKEDAQARGG